MGEIDLPLVVRRSRWRSLVSLLLSLMLFGTSIWFHVLGGPGWLGWILIVVFSSSSLYFVGQLVDSTPELIISIYGIEVPHITSGAIRWSEFSEAFVKSDSGVDYICFRLRDPERIRSQMGKLAKVANNATRQTGFGDLTIKPADLGLTTSMTSELVREQIREAKRREALSDQK